MCAVYETSDGMTVVDSFVKIQSPNLGAYENENLTKLKLYLHELGTTQVGLYDRVIHFVYGMRGPSAFISWAEEKYTLWLSCASILKIQ